MQNMLVNIRQVATRFGQLSRTSGAWGNGSATARAKAHYLDYQENWEGGKGCGLIFPFFFLSWWSMEEASITLENAHLCAKRSMACSRTSMLSLAGQHASVLSSPIQVLYPGGVRWLGRSTLWHFQEILRCQTISRDLIWCHAAIWTLFLEPLQLLSAG